MYDQARRDAGVGLLSSPMLRGSWLHAVRSFGLVCMFVWALSAGASEGEDIVLPHGSISLVGTLELAPGRALRTVWCSWCMGRLRTRTCA
jgi:hypothetical protein